MEFNAYSMLVDFMWAGIFLFVAKMLREKIKILQSLFVPVSLLAGFIGLALGPVSYTHLTLPTTNL